MTERAIVEKTTPTEEIRTERTDNIVSVERVIGDKPITIETGELAKQADGSVLVTYGDTLVLCAVTMAKTAREEMDFFPLTVEFQEKMYAAGKMPGGFFKREGRPSERSILTSRLIDRPIRPLFPEGMRNEVQVVCTVLSADVENPPDTIGMVGTSAALAISGIPFNGPIGGVRVGLVDNEFVINPTLQQLVDSSLNLIVVGTETDIMMVESESIEVDEETVLKALEIAHAEIRKITEMVNALKDQVGKPLMEITLPQIDEDLLNYVKQTFGKEVAKGMRILEKQERSKAFDEINRQNALQRIAAKINKVSVEECDEKCINDTMKKIQDKGIETTDEKVFDLLYSNKAKQFDTVIKKMQEEELRTMVVEENLRPDGRAKDEIRPISARVGFLPRTHGSGLFTRGQTQVLNSLTLAPMSEGQEVDDLGLEERKRYMHQYNFPPYSVGETKPMRGPGRREIGHGILAEKAVAPMIPDEDEFPYAIRLVSEVLESNGSSSMASVCASTLALMDAGVPIKKPVAGIAMGLVLKDTNYTVLTDIQGLEDALGEMDFKVAGTRDGITALQMDIKVQGISIEIMRDALEQAKKARLFIIDKIEEVIPEPRAELSPYAPRIFTLVIDPDKIREVIGPGGKNINKIIEETGCKIDIENDGTIYIASNNLEMAEKAQMIIEGIVSEPEVGEIYQGTVVRLTDFGAFVEIKPNKDGMIRLADLTPDRGKRIGDVVKIGDSITVEIGEIDAMGRINLKLPGVPMQPQERRGGGGGGFRGRSGGGGGRPPRRDDRGRDRR
jgi:polyribonucleotide nucleotidyltransferase